MGEVRQENKLACFHCGDAVIGSPWVFDQKSFCCLGCQGVYQLLASNDLCDYYSLEQTPGLKLKHPVSSVKFAYLDDEIIQSHLLNFRDQKISRISFHMPAMHCSSCIWLLESLYKLEKGIKNSRVDFLRKQVQITFDHREISLRKLVEVLTSLGYEPALNMNDLEGERKEHSNKRLLYQLGVAGFGFGNIMLISFPEYFGLDSFSNVTFSRLFGFLNMALATPVFVYSSRDYFTAAWNSLRKGIIGIDFPLALGILVMFLRSSYEVISHTGIGFFDTLTGLVFLLLVGKWVQQRTVDTLSFERDYKSYFPVSVSVIRNNQETSFPVSQLKISDRILIRNNEIIPADSILLKGDAHIDFSFVTGENEPVEKVLGEIIYAGGRQTGGTLELEVIKLASQSYLTQLWNSEHFAKPQDSQMKSFQSVVSKYFTLVLLGIALASALFWWIFDPVRSLNAFTSVLIIACPCALALSSPFALGNAMRLLGRSKFYLKSPEIIERMAGTNHLVFDKTGTITQPSESLIHWVGRELSRAEKNAVAILCANSIHPLSRRILQGLRSGLPDGFSRNEVAGFKEIPGKGITGTVFGIQVKMGSNQYIQGVIEEEEDQLITQVLVAIDAEICGRFLVKHRYRENLEELVRQLSTNRKISLISGDRDAERPHLESMFPVGSQLLFSMTPPEKMLYIDRLRETGDRVVMIGDGLNDAGALKAADMGISVTEDIAHFSPGSDAILDATSFKYLYRFFQYAKDTLKVIHLSFVISLLYNIVGLSFAVQGTLSPLIAAILMPLSSITVIVFTTSFTYFYAVKNHLTLE